MGIEKSAGILSIILGLIFIIFPMFSGELISIIVGLSLLFFGISAAFMGFNMRKQTGYVGIAILIIGIIAIIFGFLFIFYIDALSFLIGLQFYIVGFIMIIFGITGVLSKMTRFSTFTSILVLIMGIVAIALAAFAVSQPIYIAIIIGIVLIIEGVSMMLE
ncbi:MAG: DUF308 domain-containing protein [Methanobrevibacter sp.]|nr:DUF308 domain-containing protein [Methanobrevibacter sp.]